MLFLIEWTIPSQNRIECWNNFGNMSPSDDLQDTGDLIQIIGRWHHINGCGGVCICCTDNSEAFNSWMLNWSPLCDIKISPVVNDNTARKSLQNKPYFNSMNEEEKSNDCGEKCECSINEEEKSNNCEEKCECSMNDNSMNDMSNCDNSMNDMSNCDDSMNDMSNYDNYMNDMSNCDNSMNDMSNYDNYMNDMP